MASSKKPAPTAATAQAAIDAKLQRLEELRAEVSALEQLRAERRAAALLCGDDYMSTADADETRAKLRALRDEMTEATLDVEALRTALAKLEGEARRADLDAAHTSMRAEAGNIRALVERAASGWDQFATALHDAVEAERRHGQAQSRTHQISAALGVPCVFPAGCDPCGPSTRQTWRCSIPRSKRRLTRKPTLPSGK